MAMTPLTAAIPNELTIDSVEKTKVTISLNRKENE